MGTKVTGLTGNNVQALQEMFGRNTDVTITATTATFDMPAATALAMVDRAIAGLQRGATRASLHAVRRKLAKAAGPANNDGPQGLKDMFRGL